MTGLRFGSSLYRYDQVTSTQDVARDWVARGAGAGTVITARQMTLARGRLGRAWVHPPGANVGLTAIAPPIARADLWRVALVAGLCACDAVKRVAPQINACIRFPNDVYAGGRKLAGVLVETTPAHSGLLTPLVGIGINVQKVPLPPEIADRAVSLEAASGSTIGLADVEAALLHSLTDGWERWSGGFASLLPAWHDYLDPDARRAFVLAGETVQCRVQALELDGQVAIEADDGTNYRVHAAHVLFGEDN